MKTFKRVSSFLLAVVMIVTMLSTGLTSLASISVSKDDIAVTVTVPELIYLTPGATTFQYYIAGATNGNAPSTATATQGAVSFLSSVQADSIAVSCSGATVTMSKTGATSTNALSATITAGSVSSYTSSVLTWTFTYTYNGQTYKSYAYTYVYAPFLNQTGAQGGHKYKTTFGNEPTIVAYAFLVGIHGTQGVSTSFESKFVGTADDMFKSPLVPGWGNANVPEADGDGYFKDYATYFVQSANGGISTAGTRTRNDSKDFYLGSAEAYGILNIDSSRYGGGTLNMIPNFCAGWMVQQSNDSGTTHEMSSFASEDGALVFAQNVDYVNHPSDQGEAFMGYKSSNAIPSTNTEYAMRATFAKRRSNSSTNRMHLQFGLHINIVDKGALRSAINDAITANHQAFEYTSASYNAFLAKLKAAASVLGNPTVSNAQIQTAKDELAAAENALEITTCTVTVNHKLPAVDGFVYSYNGVNYTAANGYVTISESQSFNSGSHVTMSKEAFNGYTYNGSTPTVVKKNCTASFTQEFVYTAVTSTITFDYGAGLDSYLLDADTKSMTVTYAQPYGTFPSPRMDGWRFTGWADGAGNSVPGSTVCKMINGTLDLKANWACNFTGGHGTLADPFKIVTISDLDKIDDKTAYCLSTDGSVTKGKYYKQEADIVYSLTKTPVLEFAGNYDGSNLEINIPTGKTVADSTYGAVFGAINGATIANVKLTMNGKFSVTGTGTTYAGFIGTATASTIENVQITTGTSSEIKASKEGVLAASTTGTTVKNSSVVLNGGTLSGDAFIGAKTTTTLSNTWVLVKTEPTGFTTCSANNIMRIRENGTADLSYSNGQYSFTAVPNTGWSAEYRTADDAQVTSGTTYNPESSANGLSVYACFVKTVAIGAGDNGKLAGANSYALRQGQTVTGLNPTADAGYSFAGFTNTTDGKISSSAPYTYTMGTTGGSVTANFSVNTYTLIYDANASSAQIDVPAPATYKSTDKVIIASAPERAGYTFQNWNTKSDGSGTNYIPAQEYSALTAENDAQVTLYAIWSTNKYTVAFAVNGGVAVNEMTGVLYGARITFPTTTKTGYKDLKWHTDAAFVDAGYLPGTTKQIYDNTTFYAEWTPISYTIVFNASGATNIPAPLTVTYDSGSFIIPESYVPVKAGYEFKGWDTVSAGNGTRYYPLDTIPGNLTAVDGETYNLYAQWKESSYTVTWDLNGGMLNGSTENPTSVVTFGGMYTVPKGEFTKAGGRFDGWYTEPVGGVKITDSSTVAITGDASIYAQWLPATYTIAYNANSGTGSMDSTPATYGESVTLADNLFTRAGYTFAGWNTEADGSGISYANGASVSNLTSTDGATVTLYAQWAGAKFSITYNLNGVSGVMLATNVTMDGVAVTLRNNTKTTKTVGDDTYTFIGWAYSLDDANALKKVYDNKDTFTLNEDVLSKCDVDWEKATPTITLHAVWARNTTVTWRLMGGSLNGSSDNIITSVIRGEKIVLPEGIPMRSRFEFSGWYTAIEGGTQITNDSVLTSEEDITLYAHWVQVGNLDADYKVERYLQNADGTYPATATDFNSFSAEIGTKVSVTPTADVGYTFDETNPDNVLDGIVVDNDEGMLVLKVYYTINRYQVIFNANGGDGEMEPQIFAYGTEANIKNNTFTRTGYSFSGWSKTENGSVAYANGGHFTIGTTDVELFAVWTANKYTIEFRGNGSTEGSMDTIECVYDQTYTLPANKFSKTGEFFAGWATSASGAVSYENEATVSNLSATAGGKVILYAVWSNVFYTVTFDANGATGGTAPEARNTTFGQSLTLPTADLVIESAETKQSRTFLGWTTEDGTEYLAGASFVCPAGDVTLYALYSANYYELNRITSMVKGYRDAQVLPASAKNDPDYVAGGEIATELGLNGIYPWDNYEIGNLETVYAETIKGSYRGLKQAEQPTVDALVADLSASLENITLKNIDYDAKFSCESAFSGYYEPYTGILYPSCTDDGKHSYNELKAMVDAVLSENESTCIYTPESVLALRIELYGNGSDYAGIARDLTSENLKLPAQAKLAQYVERFAEAYHGTLKLKSADYSSIDTLLNEYLPATWNGVAFSDISSYFTVDSVNELLDYYGDYDREVKIVSQDIVDDEIYVTLKDYIDALVPVAADYSDIFYQILTIPCGTDGYAYPANDVSETDYDAWIEWAYQNDGAISAALDTEYLSARYTDTSIAALASVLDGIDWYLDIFTQNSVNGSDAYSYKTLVTNAIASLQLKTFTVTFMRNDGTDTVYTTSKGNSYGETVALPAVNPSREGFTFKGWSADTEGTTMITAPISVNADTVIYAIWKEIVESDLEMIIPALATTVIDKENGFIYGLKIGITEEELTSMYLGVIGNGHIELVYTGYIGTGTEVRLIDDTTGDVVESYQIVIFGDLNGDGEVNTQDLVEMKKMSAGIENSEMTNAKAFAADLMADGLVNNSDVIAVKGMQAGSIILDQATRMQTIAS